MSESPFDVNDRGRAVDLNVTEDERTWALFAHLSLLAHLVLPLVSIIAPIIIWVTKKETSRFLDDHGRECVNFQITLLIYSVVLPIAAAIIGAITCGVGAILLLPALALPYVLGLIGMIMGALAANRGEYYRYPMTIRFFN
jgi:uncharacterized Tic20 family protein